jgi:hypothetical protein
LNWNVYVQTKKKTCFSLLVGRPKKIQSKLQVWTALVLNKAPRPPIPSGHRCAADLRIVHGGWLAIRLIALFSAGRRLWCHAAFRGFCARVTKAPRTLFAGGVILMPFVNHAFKPRRLLIPFKLTSVSLRAPSRGFQFKWHRICKTRSNNRAFC